MSPFGRGVHFCLGVAVARMEARTAFSAMLHRMPNWNTERIGGTAGQRTIPWLRLRPDHVN
jgi:cytochrome P450